MPAAGQGKEEVRALMILNSLNCLGREMGVGWEHKWSRSFFRSNEIAGPGTDWGGGNATPGWLSGDWFRDLKFLGSTAIEAVL